MTTKDNLAVTVVDQARAFINKVTNGDTGYVTCPESGFTLTLLKEREDTMLWSHPRAGESGMRTYEGGKARKQR